jgi:hypothetical protein
VFQSFDIFRLGGGGLGFHLRRRRLVVRFLFEIPDAFSQRLPDIGEFSRAEDDQNHRQDDGQIGHAEHMIPFHDDRFKPECIPFEKAPALK